MALNFTFTESECSQMRSAICQAECDNRVLLDEAIRHKWEEMTRFRAKNVVTLCRAGYISYGLMNLWPSDDAEVQS